MSDLVGNPEDLFSHVTAKIILDEINTGTCTFIFVFINVSLYQIMFKTEQCHELKCLMSLKAMKYAKMQSAQHISYRVIS